MEHRREIKSKSMIKITERVAMHDLIRSSDRERNRVWVATKVLLNCWLLLLTACTTAYAPAGQPRNYSETQLGRNVFAVRVGETAQASNRKATELCLLRCAEVTLANGFRHFVILESAVEQERATTDRLKPSSTHPRDVSLSLINPAAGSPSSANTIACFRTPPTGYPEAYDAAAVFRQLSGKYTVRKTSQAHLTPADASPLQF